MKRKKKKAPKQRNPVVRTLIQNPKRNAGAHKRKKPTKRDERRIEECSITSSTSMTMAPN
jgi:hypothetical protein